MLNVLKILEAAHLLLFYVACGHIPCVWSGDWTIYFLHSSLFTKHFFGFSHNNSNVCIP